MLKKTFLKITSTLLSLVMLLQLLPAQIFATELTAEADSNASLQPASEAHVVAELPEERTAYTKTFRLSNGLNMAAVYNDPVHYEKDGKWAEIGNSTGGRFETTEKVPCDMPPVRLREKILTR